MRFDGLRNTRDAMRAVAAKAMMAAARWAKGALALAITSVWYPSAASAQAETWALLHETDDVFVLVNTEVIAGYYPSAWMALVRKPDSELFDDRSAVIFEQSDYDCAKRTGSVKYRAKYDVEGHPAGGQSVYEVKQPFVPHTVGDALMQFACGFAEPPRPTIISPLSFQQILQLTFEDGFSPDEGDEEMTDEAADAATLIAEEAADAAEATDAAAAASPAEGPF